MADDVFEKILAAINKGNDRLAQLDTDLTQAVNNLSQSPAKEQPERKSKQEKKPETNRLLNRLFEFSKQVGKRNPVTDIAENVAKTANRFASRDTSPAPKQQLLKTVVDQTKLAIPVARPARPTAPPIQPDGLKAKAAKAPVAGPVAGTIKPKALPVAAAAGAGVAEEAAGAAAITGAMAGASEAVAGLGASLVAAIPVVGQVAAAIAIVVGAFAALAAGVVALTSKFLESQKELAKYNGALAVTFAQSKYREIRRDTKTAQETATGTVNLNNAFEDLKDAWQPIKSVLINLTSSVLTPMVRILTAILNFLKPLFDLLDKLRQGIEWIAKKLGFAPAAAPPVQLLPAERAFIDASKGIVRRRPMPIVP